MSEKHLLDTREGSDSDKKKVKKASQVRPEDCRVETGGVKIKLPDHLEGLIKLAGDHSFVDYNVLLNITQKRVAVDQLDTTIDHKALDGEEVQWSSGLDFGEVKKSIEERFKDCDEANRTIRGEGKSVEEMDKRAMKESLDFETAVKKFYHSKGLPLQDEYADDAQ